jgi:hypothetical protein
MRNGLRMAVLAVGVFAFLSACSARTQLAMEETKKNGAHFATPETTTKGDVEIAKADRCLPSQTCAWWGEPVKVQPIQ